MNTLLIVVSVVMGLFVGLPVLAYLCSKFSTYGKLRARELFSKTHKGDRK